MTTRVGTSGGVESHGHEVLAAREAGVSAWMGAWVGAWMGSHGVRLDERKARQHRSGSKQQQEPQQLTARGCSRLGVQVVSELVEALG